MAQYNALITDGANRIFAVFESQVQHRIAMDSASQALDKAESAADIQLAREGMRYGFLVAIAFLIAAFVLILTGHDTSGTVLGTFDIVALVTAFVREQNRQSDPTQGEELRGSVPQSGQGPPPPSTER